MWEQETGLLGQTESGWTRSLPTAPSSPASSQIQRPQYLKARGEPYPQSWSSYSPHSPIPSPSALSPPLQPCPLTAPSSNVLSRLKDPHPFTAPSFQTPFPPARSSHCLVPSPTLPLQPGPFMARSPHSFILRPVSFHSYPSSSFF